MYPSILRFVFLFVVVLEFGSTRADFVWNAGLDLANAERDGLGGNRPTETNAVNQFASQWSYGQSTSVTGAGFTGAPSANHVNDYNNGFFTANTFDGWVFNDNSALMVNYTNQASNHFQGQVASKEIFFHPGSGNVLFPTIQFTVPTSGQYSLDAYWRH